MSKYKNIPRINISDRVWPDNEITESPTWCAVDLRDGNQALPNPMTPQQKKEYFNLLCEIGFKEIEVGFPSASEDDFQFCRDLIEQDMIPDDVVISVLTQARPHLISKTVDVLKGVKKAIIHVYIATSTLHMKYVFKKTEKDTIETIRDAVKQIKDESIAKLSESDIGLEFSPEEFTDTDIDFAVEICDEVVEQWNPKKDEKVILNLPATVERRPPTHYADMIELFNKKQAHRDNTIISIHSHNDMGCAVASSEMAVMAGASRVEGTLFGHGERTGNVDLVTMICNLQYMGVSTAIDFSNLDKISEVVSRITDFAINPRHPYAGDLVFTAFSGSHQDAIHKGIKQKDKLINDFGKWKIPYLHVDPFDFGRKFEKYIRINSQSGKGGIAHVLTLDFGIPELPRYLQVDLAKHVQAYADEQSRELGSEEVWNIFMNKYFCQDGELNLISFRPVPAEDNPSRVNGIVKAKYNGKEYKVSAEGNGPIASLIYSLQKLPISDFTLEDYDEGVIGKHSADAEAICIVCLKFNEEKQFSIGIGMGQNIDQAAAQAVVSAINLNF